MELELLAGLNAESRRTVLAAARRRRFSRREVIFHEGDPGDALHVVASGHVGLRVGTPLGDVAMVRVLASGEFFGELSLISPGARSATAFALEPCQTLSIGRDAFSDLRTRNPTVTEVVLTALAIEVRRLAAAQAEALFLPAEQRVFRRLADLARSYGPDIPVTIPITQEEVGQLAGTTRSTANRLLQEAQDAGVVTLARGRIQITDLDWIDRRGR